MPRVRLRPRMLRRGRSLPLGPETISVGTTLALGFCYNRGVGLVAPLSHGKGRPARMLSVERKLD